MVAVPVEVQQVLFNTTTNDTSNLAGISDPSTSLDLYTRVSLTLLIGTFPLCVWHQGSDYPKCFLLLLGIAGPSRAAGHAVQQ